MRRDEPEPGASPGSVDPVVPADRVRVMLPADASSGRRARVQIEQVLEAWGVAELSEPAELLVSELVTNAVTHVGGEVELHVERLPAGVRVEVHDHDEDTDATRPRHVDAGSPSGRGLLIVDRVADRWGVERTDQGKRVWFELSPDGVTARWRAVGE